jgi:hypothetical protein
MAKQALTGTSSQGTEGGAEASDAGVKEIPLGMSVNDMKSSNEAAVASIEDAGKQAGVDAENERCKAIDAAFPNDPAFAAECRAKKGFTVLEAKAAKFDQVTAANVELAKKNAELTEKAKAANPAIEFASSDSEGGSSVDEGTVNEKDAKSIEVWNKNEKLRVAYNGNKSAFQATYRNDPETALSFGK